MKKLLVLIASFGMFSNVFADHDLNLNKATLSCGSYKISNKSTIAEINKNCKVVKSKTEKEHGNTEQKVIFATDNGSVIKCSFKNDKLHKCKMND